MTQLDSIATKSSIDTPFRAGPRIVKVRHDAAHRVALVTGCSSGIGAATAKALLDAGFLVVATARRPDALTTLAGSGCSTLALDVTSDASMCSAVAAVEAQYGAVDLLVNNAGYGQAGVVEEVSVELARRQFETNVFGALRLAQLVLPGMRRRGSGRIVNVSSMGGRLTFPYFGLYHASKYALEALSDALRMEVAGFGVRVVLVEPGLIRTNFGQASLDTTSSSLNVTTESPYADFVAHMARATVETYEKGPLAALSAGPEAVARSIVRAATVRRPKARYTVSASAKLLIFLRRVLPDALWDAVMRLQYPLPRSLPRQHQQSAIPSTS
jgi:NAD(P)-dependent dehydrogenase (short-subunit alcohol dehydrogenase family)